MIKTDKWHITNIELLQISLRVQSWFDMYTNIPSIININRDSMLDSNNRGQILMKKLSDVFDQWYGNEILLSSKDQLCFLMNFGCTHKNHCEMNLFRSGLMCYTLSKSLSPNDK